MTSDCRKLYYVYTDDSTGQIYFYDTCTGSTTFTRPSEGHLIDPETQKPYRFEPPSGVDPPTESARRRRHHDRVRGPSAAMADELFPPLARLDQGIASSARFLRTSGFRRSSHSFHHSPLAVFAPSEGPMSTRHPEGSERVPLCPIFMSEIARFQSEESTRGYFPDDSPSKAFKRRFVELSPGVKFQSEPIKTPLLLTTNRSEAKISIAAFKLILQWTGASGKDQCSASTCRKLLKILKDVPELRDEIFCQLVKQTRMCPDPGCLSNTWDLFLIIATIFPSSKDSEGFIKSHLASCAKAPNPRVADFAQFTFIRFSSRCAIGHPLEPVTNELLSRIPHDPYMNHASFEASIYEQLWVQRTAYPQLSVPHLLCLLSEFVIKKGGPESVGLFRLSGNVVTVKEAIASVNRGADPVVTFDQLSINDCAALFKAWFMCLPERIISIDNFNDLQTAYETTKNYRACVDGLLPAQIAVLKFVVGFLRKLATYEAVTKMGLSNFRIIFSPIIVSMPKLDDPVAAMAHTMISLEFVGWLFENLDPDGVYPVSPDVLLGNSG
jgi:hypothetical protein